jgi:aminoglycoside phosphotransferase (APT) family kinase protein
MGIAAIPDWPFYLAFSFFRLAAIIQGVKKRALEGNASNPERAKQLGTLVPVLAEKAIDLAINCDSI